MQWLASLSVRRAVFASVLILVIVVLGLAGYRGLSVDKFPKVDFPMVTVVTVYPGASPSAVESDVTDKIESAVNTIGGLETLTSMSNEGVSTVFVQFNLEKPVDVAAQEVRDRVQTVLRDLPSGVEQPVVQKIDPDASPILMLSLKGNRPIEEMTRIAEDVVKRRLETIDGVGQVMVIGGRKRQINIRLDPVRLRAANVSALEVQRAIAVANADIPGGRLDEGPSQATIRIVGRATVPDDIGALIVRQQGEHPIRVRDVAQVEDGTEDVESAGFRDGQPTIVLAVRKQSGGNTVKAVDATKAAAAELAHRLPSGVTLEVVRDNSESIRTSISAVLEHLVLGALLAALVVLIFLGDWRSTIISAISIPVSVIGTFALMKWFGYTLNLMTLLALALSVGIVIDDSIIVLENIHRFIHEKGMKPFPAAIAATKEIGLAVLATSLSLMAVFLPVAFMGGIVGRFLASFGVTMAIAIGVSLIVAFTIVPMLSARFLPPTPPPEQHKREPLMERIVNFFYRPVERVYMAMLRFTMRRRWIIAILCVLAMASVGPLAKRAGFGFLPVNDDAQFEIYLQNETGSSVDATAVLSQRVARWTRAIPGVRYTLTTIGDGAQQQSNVAHIYVRLADPNQRKDDQNLIMEETRQALAGRLPKGATALVQVVSDFGSGMKNAPVMYVIAGPDLGRLETYAHRAIAELAKVPGVVDPDTSILDPSPETTLRPDFARAAQLGVDPGDVAATLRLLVAGADTSKYEEEGSQYDVNVRADEKYRNDPSSLGLLTVPSRTLGHVPLSDVVQSEDGLGPTQINRLARERQVTLSCQLAPGADQGQIVKRLEGILAGLHMPAGYHSEVFGQTKEMKRMGKAFMFAFLLAFIFMYLVLAAQFESWLHPLTILLALPLTLPFAFLSLVLFHGQLNIFSLLGLLVLFGIVKKNAILQIDQSNQLREHGMPRMEAILEANRHRLRPILMTTIAFVAGMLPLVFSHGIGAGFSKAMASIVVGGQTLSLLLTLLAIPVIYSAFDDIGIKLRRLVVRLRGNALPIDRGAAEVGVGLIEPTPALPAPASAAAAGPMEPQP